MQLNGTALSRTVLSAATLLALPMGVLAKTGCKPIQFAHGASTTTISGTAPAEDTVCFTLATGKGQTANLKVTSGANTVFGIDGMVDAQDTYRFTTEHKTYEIDVGQLERSVTPEAFAIDVSVQ